MARKTRREKLLAQKHRQKQLQSVNTPTLSSPVVQLPNTNPSHYQLPNLTIPKEVKPVAAADYSYVIADLKRITTLTLLAFSASIVLWYFLGRG